jgi:hypothetical protein
MIRLVSIASTLACAAIALYAPPSAWAGGTIDLSGGARAFGDRGAAARATLGGSGSQGSLGARRGLVTDGQGNAQGSSARGFTTDDAQGARTRRFERSADGSVDASGKGSVSTAKGDAERSGSFTRDASGNGNGERSTSVTNASTGVTLDASSTYSKGSGVSRSASCKDAAGNTVTCGSL